MWRSAVIMGASAPPTIPVLALARSHDVPVTQLYHSWWVRRTLWRCLCSMIRTHRSCIHSSMSDELLEHHGISLKWARFGHTTIRVWWHVNLNNICSIQTGDVPSLPVTHPQQLTNSWGKCIDKYNVWSFIGSYVPCGTIPHKCIFRNSTHSPSRLAYYHHGLS